MKLKGPALAKGILNRTHNTPLIVKIKTSSNTIPVNLIPYRLAKVEALRCGLLHQNHEVRIIAVGIYLSSLWVELDPLARESLGLRPPKPHLHVNLVFIIPNNNARNWISSVLSMRLSIFIKHGFCVAVIGNNHHCAALGSNGFNKLS